MAGEVAGLVAAGETGTAVEGTRVIGEDSVAETNMLGMALPDWVERPLNKMAYRLLPGTFQRLDSNRSNEEGRRQRGDVKEIAA